LTDVQAGWQKSSRSMGNGACVEVRRLDRTVEVRDSKNHRGGFLRFDLPIWAAFVEDLKVGAFAYDKLNSHRR
jgi:hypothetical protein